MSEDDLIKEANRLFSGRVEFLLSAPQLKFLPEPDAPEIAFAGRSNVGKSSLLNALTGRRAIARTSVTPGRTQELNFFDVGDPTRFRLVDMPGYGFAKAPIKIVDNWKKLVRTYLRGRAVLKRTLVLIDARHGIKPPDAEMMAMLDEAAVGYRLGEDGESLEASQWFEDPATLENNGARFIRWDKGDDYVRPYECDPTFALEYAGIEAPETD